MKLRQLLRLGNPQESPITVLGMSVEPRCGYCNRAFRNEDIVILNATTGVGFHMHCQVELDRSPKNWWDFAQRLWSVRRRDQPPPS